MLRVDIRGQQPLTVSADAAPAEARQLRYQEFANSIQMRRAQDAVREACNDRGLNCQLPETQVQQMLANWETEADYEERQRHGVRVSFCQVSFGRGWQLRLSLAINLLMCRKQLGYSVRFVVVLYQVDGNDLSTQAKTAIRKDYFETIQWLKHNCKPRACIRELGSLCGVCPSFSFLENEKSGTQVCLADSMAARLHNSNARGR